MLEGNAQDCIFSLGLGYLLPITRSAGATVGAQRPKTAGPDEAVQCTRVEDIPGGSRSERVEGIISRVENLFLLCELEVAGGVSGAANFDSQPGDDLYVQPFKDFNKIALTYVLVL